MLDPWMRRRFEPLVAALGRRLAGQGIGADTLTLVGFVVGLGAAGAVALEAYGWGLALFALNRVLDGLDGAVARVRGATDRGAFLDITLDFVVYAALPLAFAVADPARNAVWAALLLFTFIGTGSSFLAFAIFAQKRGLETTRSGRKGLFYLGGLAEGTETAAVLMLMCALPTLFPWLAGGFAVACLMTAGARIWAGSVSLAERDG